MQLEPRLAVMPGLQTKVPLPGRNKAKQFLASRSAMVSSCDRVFHPACAAYGRAAGNRRMVCRSKCLGQAQVAVNACRQDPRLAAGSVPRGLAPAGKPGQPEGG